MTTRPRLLIAVLTVITLALAACGGGGGGEAPIDEGTAADGAPSANIAVTGTDDLAFTQEQLRAAPGEVTVELTCEDAVNHDFTIEELDDRAVAACDPGATDTGTVELEPGSYTFYCSVPGHRSGGMEGLLIVEE